MSRLSSRRVVGAGILSIAAIVTVLAATSVTAAPSRAANRWNHVETPSVSAALASTDSAGVEPMVSGPTFKTFHLVQRYGNRFTFVDVAPKGDSPGDYGVFKDQVFTRGGVRIGTIDAQCIAAYSDQCTGSIRIPGRGQITFSGITPLGQDPDHYAVTGGTGQFARVGGSLTISFPNANEAALTIVLTR